MPSSGSYSARVPPRTWGLLGLVVVLAALVRARLLNVPFERDEGEYAYAGQLILSGVPPYSLLYNMKLPGTYLVYALAMAVFGQTIAGARLGLLIATSLTAVGVFQLARRFVPPTASLAGAAAYATLALSTEMLGPFGHATHFVVLFAVWGLVVLATALERGDSGRILLAGVLLGLSVLMKQPGGVFLICAAVWIIAEGRGKRARNLAVLSLGAAAPLAMLAAWLFFSGSFGRFWLWVVRYGPAYGSLLGITDGWVNLRDHVSWIVPQAPVLWLLTGLGIGLLFARRLPRVARQRAASLFVLSFAGVCPGFYFREHYFLVLVPAVAILVALASHELASVARVGRWLAPAVVAIGCAQAFYTQREVLFRATPDEVSRLLYGPNLFVESIPIARYLAARTGPEDRLVILGSEPQILFYARRRSATGIVYMYPLLEDQPLAAEMGEVFIQEVEQRRPAYAVLIGNPESWYSAPEPRPRILEWAPAFFAENYVMVGQVVAADEGTRYLWEEEAARRPISRATQAIVMRRRGFVPVLP